MSRIFALVVLFGCSQSTPATQSQPVSQAPTPTPTPPPSPPLTPSLSPTLPPAAAQVRRVQVQPSDLQVSRLPDGRIAIDVKSPTGWPGRGQDPVLYIGNTAARDYAFPAPRVIRFVVDAASMHDGDPVSLQYGNDRRSRIQVTDSLSVPK